jgi:fermentation-respiration switch protein FrsA (DUF1100 family)
MGRRLASFIIILLIAYAVIVIFVYFKQDSMLFFPQKEMWQTPKDYHLEYEELNLLTKDGININGWYIPAEQEKAAMLFCHGNAGNISHRLDSIKIFNSLGLSVLIFDYRGYGRSGGKPSEKGSYNDGEAGWDYLVQAKKYSPESIVVFGRSLGGAIAAEIALRKDPGALIIESSFTSVPDMGKVLYPWLPVKLLSKFRYATIDKVNAIPSPKLIIHSPDDDIIPYKQGTALYEQASQPKVFLEIKGGHNDGFIIAGERYIEGLSAFLKTYLSGRKED